MLTFFVVEQLEARQLLSAAWTSHAPLANPARASRHHRIVPLSVRRGRVDALTLPVATLTQSTGVISELRDGSAATVLGGKAFFAGGLSTLRDSAVVDIYDGATRQWSTAHLSIGRQAITAVSVGDTALFGGGIESGDPYDDTNVVDLYDNSTGQWSAALLSRKRWWPGAAAVGTKAIFVGGDYDKPSATADIYDSETAQWSIEAIPVPIGTSVGLTLGNLVLFPATSTLMDVYNSVTGQWSTAPFPSDASLPGVAVGTKAVFADQQGGLEIFDAVSGEWSTVAPVNRAGPGQDVAAVGTMVIYAGDNDRGPVSVFDVATGKWSEGPPLSAARSAMGATTLGDTAIFAGGDDGGYDDDRVVDFYTDTAPTPVLSGTVVGRAGGRMEVTVMNTGDAALEGSFKVNIYATSGGHHGAVLLGSVSVPRAVAAGETVRVQVPVEMSAGMSAGRYHFVAAVQNDAGEIVPLSRGEGTLRVR